MSPPSHSGSIRLREPRSGQLYIVATPIGHLKDVTQRAVDTLRRVDYIAAEDTRHSARLLHHFNITTPVIAYHEHSEQQRRQQLLDWLAAGREIALISDAGTPLISDPGYTLVREARIQGVKVTPIPGACALVAALSVAGLPSDRFLFEGFPPAKALSRQAYFNGLAGQTATMIFYESPHRILASLAAMVTAFGPQREAVIARELTKTFETILSGQLRELLAQVKADPNQQRGEFVVLVNGLPKQPSTTTISPEAGQTMSVLLAELPVGQAAMIGAKLTGLKRRDLYQWALTRLKTEQGLS